MGIPEIQPTACLLFFWPGLLFSNRPHRLTQLDRSTLD
jgi:hypothetical protein